MAEGFSASRQTSISPSHCRPSYILYLKKKERILYSDFVNSGLRADCLNHPVLVVRKASSRSSLVEICILTTFGGVSVENRYPHDQSIWAKYIPIYPTKPALAGGAQLQLGDLRLRKPSYVGIQDKYTVHTDMLDCYSWRHMVSEFYLDDESFNLVLHNLQSVSQRRPPPRVDESDIYTPTIRDQEVTHSKIDSLYGRNQDDWYDILTGDHEWDGGIVAAYNLSNQSAAIRSTPSIPIRNPQIIMQHPQPSRLCESIPKRKEEIRNYAIEQSSRQYPGGKEAENGETGKMVLVGAGIVLAAWLGLKVFGAFRTKS